MGDLFIKAACFIHLRFVINKRGVNCEACGSGANMHCLFIYLYGYCGEEAAVLTVPSFSKLRQLWVKYSPLYILFLQFFSRPLLGSFFVLQ